MFALLSTQERNRERRHTEIGGEEVGGRGNRSEPSSSSTTAPVPSPVSFVATTLLKWWDGVLLLSCGAGSGEGRGRGGWGVEGECNGRKCGDSSSDKSWTKMWQVRYIMLFDLCNHRQHCRISSHRQVEKIQIRLFFPIFLCFCCD